MEREGLVAGSQTLYDQVEALARVLAGVRQTRRELLDEPVVFADETPSPSLRKFESSAKWHARGRS